MLLPVPFSGRNRRDTVAFFSIASFVIVFIVCIIWATRPAHKGESRYH